MRVVAAARRRRVMLRPDVRGTHFFGLLVLVLVLVLIFLLWLIALTADSAAAMLG
jgi:hypothetical protein